MRSHRSLFLPAARCGLLSFFAFAGFAYAQDQTVTGNLTVTQGAILGSSLSAGRIEIRPGGVLVGKGTYGSSPVLLSTEQGAGTRLLWHPRKAALRAGRVTGTQWDEASIGNDSIALGLNPKASGYASVAIGVSSVASGDHSMAMGPGAVASGIYSVAVGTGQATNYQAIGMGFGYAAGLNSLATGEGYAGGMFSTAMGGGQASGDYSTAMGYSLADSFLSTAIGLYNLGGGSPDQWIPTDPLFEIGNGYENWVPSNALTVYKNGNMDVQGAITCAPGGDIPMFGE